jgi:hypothetical protein
MARVNLTISTEGEVALVAATEKTVLKIDAPTNQKIAVHGWGVYFDGTSSSAEPVNIKLVRLTTAGTFTSVTPRKVDTDDGITTQTSAGKNATVQPTLGDILKHIEVHPQSGYEEHRPFGREYIVPGAGRLGIAITAPAGVNCQAWMDIEE